jgi:ABC-type transport system involved in multi-copper enzyme maturation permease subunit
MPTCAHPAGLKVALMMSVLSFSDERGSELLLAQPVTRTQVLTGKVAGVYATPAVALLFGFGASGLVIAVQAGGEGVVPLSSVCRLHALAGPGVCLRWVLVNY